MHQATVETEGLKTCMKTRECTWMPDDNFLKKSESQDQPGEGWCDCNYTKGSLRDVLPVVNQPVFQSQRAFLHHYNGGVGKLVAHLIATWTGCRILSTNLKLVCFTYSFFSGKGGMVANNIIDRNTNRKGNPSLNCLAVNLFRIQFGSLCFHDGVSEFTEIQDLGSRDTLSDYSFQCQVDNFRGLLVLGTNITKNRENTRGKMQKNVSHTAPKCEFQSHSFTRSFHHNHERTCWKGRWFQSLPLLLRRR